MRLRNKIYRLGASQLKKYPVVWRGVLHIDRQLERVKTLIAQSVPQLLEPDPRQLYVAITAHCNLRCIGCRYERGFMPEHQLPLPMVRALLSDARSAGIPRVRFYGGEPLLHPDLPEMIREATALGLNVYVTTNGVLLSKRMSDLYSAGLREITLGFYGVGVAYDRYVGRRGAFRVLETGVRAVRERYGDSVRMGLNWLLTRESCTPAALAAACEFADAHDLQVQVDLIHYSLPYLSEGPDRRLQFKREDELKIRAVIADLLRRKRSNPGRFCQSLAGLSSIPDWLLLQSRMRIPCHSHQLLWVGADGSVQLCYVGFPLGNLYQQSFSSIIGSRQHVDAARKSFELKCSNCHCDFDARILKHLPSWLRYTREWCTVLAADGTGETSSDPVVLVRPSAFGNGT